MLLALLLLAASGRFDLVDQVYHIPPSDWRYIEVPQLRTSGALVWGTFEVEGNPAGEVRLALMRRDDLEKLRGDLPHGLVGTSSIGRSGTMVAYVPQPGDYVVVVDNLGEHAVQVRLRIGLDLHPHHGMEPTQLSPEKRLTIVILSLGGFCAICVFAGRRLWRGMRL